jgi:hypothetical protein
LEPYSLGQLQHGLLPSWKHHPLSYKISEFMAEFEAVFGDSDKARTSANKLRRLHQKTRSAIVYASKFRQLACDVNWGEAASID